LPVAGIGRKGGRSVLGVKVMSAYSLHLSGIQNRKVSRRFLGFEVLGSVGSVGLLGFVEFLGFLSYGLRVFWVCLVDFDEDWGERIEEKEKKLKGGFATDSHGQRLDKGLSLTELAIL